MFEEEKEQNEHHSATIPRQIECHTPSGSSIRATANALGTEQDLPHGGRQLQGGINLLFGQIFPKTTWKFNLEGARIQNFARIKYGIALQ